MRLNSNSCHIYASIGLVKMHLGYHLEAIDWFHKALAIRRDDPFTTAIMNYALEDFIKVPLVLQDTPNEIPKFIPKKTIAKPFKAEERTDIHKEEMSNTDGLYWTPSGQEETDDFYSPLDMSIED